MDIPSSASSGLYNNAVSKRFDASPSGGLSETLNQGVNGLQNASGQLLQSAHNIATSYSEVGANGFDPSKTADLAKDLVNQRQAQLLFTASAEVVSVADELAGKMIDEIV